MTGPRITVVLPDDLEARIAAVAAATANGITAAGELRRSLRADGGPRCGWNQRHWFAPYGQPGVVLPACIRCSAGNPAGTRDLEDRLVDVESGCASCGIVGGHLRGCTP